MMAACMSFSRGIKEIQGEQSGSAEPTESILLLGKNECLLPEATGSWGLLVTVAAADGSRNKYREVDAVITKP